MFLYISIFFQIITFHKTAAETVFQFLKSVSINLILSVIIHHTSVSTIFRLLFSPKFVTQERTIIASQLFNSLNDKKNCTAVILQNYLEIACGGQKLNSQTKIIPVMDDPQKVREIVEKSSLDGAQMIQAGTLVDWLSTLSTVELEIGSTGKYKFQVLQKV